MLRASQTSAARAYVRKPSARENARRSRRRLKNSPRDPRRALTSHDSAVHQRSREARRRRSTHRRENDLRSRTYSESDFAARKRTQSPSVVTRFKYLRKRRRYQRRRLAITIDTVPREESRDYNPRVEFYRRDDENERDVERDAVMARDTKNI